ncbi:MAG: hypothetical protein QNJ45_18420 [Ardenticatenaceae bacterium]|nr:hypothetical protein [Ardenticatenaceae bacterium]
MMKNQSSILVGFLLILLGTCFLLVQFIPGLSQSIDFALLWPLIPLGLGVIFFVSGVVASPPMLIPGTILSGIGMILFVSNTFNWWDFWQLWLLIPAFVGIGIVLSEIRQGKGLQRSLSHGGPPLIVGIVLFVVFTAVFSSSFSFLWPILLIILGVGWLMRSILFRR